MSAVRDDRRPKLRQLWGQGVRERPLSAIIIPTTSRESYPLAAAMLVQRQGGFLTKYVSLLQRH